MSKKLIITGVLFVLLVILGISSCERVPVGNVAVQYSMSGGLKNEVLTQGYHFVSPTISTTIYPIFTQQGSMTKDITDKSPTNEQFSVSTNSTKAVYVDCEFTYHVEKENVVKLYNKFGGKKLENIENEVIKKKLPMLISNVTSNIDAIDLQGGGNLAEINKSITEYCKKAFEDYYITIESVQIKAEIDDKSQRAIQERMDSQQRLEKAKIEKEIQVVENEKRLAQEEANKKMQILRAEGQAESKRIIAEAEAKANKMLAQSLTQEFIEYTKANKWDGKYPTTLAGDSNLIIDSRK